MTGSVTAYKRDKPLWASSNENLRPKSNFECVIYVPSGDGFLTYLARWSGGEWFVSEDLRFDDKEVKWFEPLFPHEEEVTKR